MPLTHAGSGLFGDTMLQRLLRFQLILVTAALVVFVVLPVAGLAQQRGAMILSVAWSPDGTMLASITDDGTLTVTTPSQSTPIFEFTRPSILNKAAVEWSPSGDRLAAGIGNRMYLWDVEPWQLLYEYEVGLPGGFFTWGPFDNIPEGVQTITWSLDGRYLVVGTYSYETSVWDTHQGQLIYRAGDLSGGGPGRVWLSDDGWMGDGANKLNAFSGQYSFPSIEDNQRAFGGSAEGGTTEARPDNSQIAWGTVSGELLIIDLNTTRGVIGIEVTDNVPASPRRNISDVSWNGTWEFIAVISNDGELYIVNLATRDVATVLNINGRLTTVDWNPRTNQVTYGGVSSAGEPVLETVDVSGIAGVPDDTPTTADTPVASQSPKHFQRTRTATNA